MMDLLKGSFFNNSCQRDRILILLSSCSRLKEVGGLSSSFVLGARGFDSGDE
jgi:hypothetical protein